MTTIAYRDGVMASDSRAYTGSREPIGTKLKSRRFSDGTLIGATSAVPGGGEQVIQWYMAGAKPDDSLPATFTLLAVKPDGSAFYASNTALLSGPITAPYYAIGSGGEYALGAMEMGASAVEAVRVACKLDVWSDAPINCFSHRSSNSAWKVAA